MGPDPGRPLQPWRSGGSNRLTLLFPLNETWLTRPPLGRFFLCFVFFCALASLLFTSFYYGHSFLSCRHGVSPHGAPSSRFAPFLHTKRGEREENGLRQALRYGSNLPWFSTLSLFRFPCSHLLPSEDATLARPQVQCLRCTAAGGKAPGCFVSRLLDETCSRQVCHVIRKKDYFK